MRNSVIFGFLLSSLASLVNASPRPVPLPGNPPGLKRRDLKDATPSAEIKDNSKKVYNVTVAKSPHAYNPTRLTNVKVGDYIRFQFYPRTHSVVLGVYDVPCTPYGYAHPGENDVWSGLVTAEDVTENLQEWVYQVTSNDPQFFYCSGPKSCTDWGMVFALNPNSTQTWAAYHNLSKGAPYQISPGEIAPSEDGSDSGSGANGLSTGAIVGIVIGGVATIALIGLLFFLIGRKKSSPEKVPEATALAQPLSSPMAQNYSDHPPHPPPGYEHRSFSPTPLGASPQMVQTGWAPMEAAKSPALGYNPRDSVYSDSMYAGAAGAAGAAVQRPEHQSWAPSELSAAPREPVEIYTPGVDDAQRSPRVEQRRIDDTIRQNPTQ